MYRSFLIFLLFPLPFFNPANPDYNLPEYIPSDLQEQGIHDTFDRLLKEHVSVTGNVQYAEFRKDKDELVRYLELLELLVPSSMDSDEARLAYWINLYNAATIKLVLDHYPVQSIREIDEGKPWDRIWIKVGGQDLSLNQIEHEIIRPGFNDARIHFVLNCAARSCPPLLNKAYTAENLNQLMDLRTKAFINDPQFNLIEQNTLYLSRIFEWYEMDFEPNVIHWVNRFVEGIDLAPEASVEYKKYDWGLNGR